MPEALLLLAALAATADVTVEVRRAGPEGPAPGPGAPVTLQALPADGDTPIQEWFGVSDEAGRAAFQGVTIHPGARYVASAVADGVAYDSRPAALREGSPATLPVILYATGADISQVRVGRVFTRVRLWEAQLEVHQAWTLLNGGSTAFDPKRVVSGDKGLIIRLPEGAQGARVDGLPDTHYQIAGTKLLYTGVLRPGPAGAVEVRVAFTLEYSEGVYAFSQPSAYPVDDLLTVIPVAPTVRHTRLDHVRLSVGAHNHGTLSSATEDGGAVWVLSGAPAEPGLRFEVAGLPHYDLRPAWAALFAGLGIVVWGLARILQGGGGPAPAPPAPAPLSSADLGALRQRRDELMERLVGLEREPDGPDGSEADRGRRREALKRRLVDVDRRLGGAS